MPVLYNDVQMDKKQPGIQMFWHFRRHYQDIYDCIIPINKPSDWWFILWWKMSIVIPVICIFFTYLKHLMMFFNWTFSGIHLYTLSKTFLACRATQLRVLKRETLLNNAFNVIDCVFFFLKSGAIGHPWLHHADMEEAVAMSSSLAKALGCDTSTPSQMVACLREKSMQDFLDVYENVRNFLYNLTVLPIMLMPTHLFAFELISKLPFVQCPKHN